jgi:hypothetical protein
MLVVDMKPKAKYKFMCPSCCKGRCITTLSEVNIFATLKLLTRGKSKGKENG